MKKTGHGYYKKKKRRSQKNQIKYKTIKNQIKRIKLTSDLCILCSTKKIKKERREDYLNGTYICTYVHFKNPSQ